jgi:putative transposase
VRCKPHAGFGERPGETGWQQCRNRAPGRLNPGWSPLQRTPHAYHQDVLARAGRMECGEARRSAQNRATRSVTAGVAVVPSPRGDSTDQTDGTTTLTGAGRTPVHAA